ncbi:hypothetical protein NB636_01055 [Oxalobacter aliiformigenes]|uniref:hypothetical protein n=1 Tax=Oxalobacter aliiformigenes TaxID=2946593 RepID=UPI0022AF72D3|nr:hypothetical protein [Oxalobacter aliiformigenes]MCZ4064102.1 hypothetical protein [Oxalobacter aliiformigenes]WAV99479.1 hypothetical protein NB636_01055 [Oxalobacter aliiformigenes]
MALAFYQAGIPVQDRKGNETTTNAGRKMITEIQNWYISNLLVDMVKEGKSDEAKKAKNTLVELFKELNEVTGQKPEPADCGGQNLCGECRC